MAPPAATEPDPPEFELRVRAVLGYVDGLRELGRHFCVQTFQDPSLAERVAVAIQETLENGVKYALPDSVGEIELWIRTQHGRLAITCTSRPDPAHLAQLRDELDHLRSLAPEAGFRAALERAARERQEPSRLGLARLRHEGRFELELVDGDDGRIGLTATTPL